MTIKSFFYEKNTRHKYGCYFKSCHVLSSRRQPKRGLTGRCIPQSTLNPYVSLNAYRDSCPRLKVKTVTMEMLRRSSVFAAEVFEVFDRSPTDKELVAQGKALCRDFIQARLQRAGLGWNKPEHGISSSVGGRMAEVSATFLRLGR